MECLAYSFTEFAFVMLITYHKIVVRIQLEIKEYSYKLYSIAFRSGDNRGNLYKKLIRYLF